MYVVITVVYVPHERIAGRYCRYFFRHKTTYLQIPAQWWAALMSLCATIRRYFAGNTCKYLLLLRCMYHSTITVLLYFCKKYLHILRRFLRRFLRWFLRWFLRGCIAVCAVASVASLLHRCRIAVASPHRIASLATCRLH
jgi:hypothetical protein